MENTEFPIDFHSDLEGPNSAYYGEVEHRIRALARGHTDVTGAAVSLEKPVQGRETSPLFEASVVVYLRPANVAAVEKADGPLTALQGALDAVERQVREQRDKLRGH